VYTVTVTRKFSRLAKPLIVIFAHAAREPAHKNGYGHMPWKFGRPWPYRVAARVVLSVYEWNHEMAVKMEVMSLRFSRYYSLASCRKMLQGLHNEW